MFDAEQKLIICNKRYAEIYGLAPEHTQPGTPLRTILQHRVARGVTPEQTRDYVDDAARGRGRAAKPGMPSTSCPTGTSSPSRTSRCANGGSVAMHEDITERRKAEAQIAYMAHHDALTDLPNRVRFREQLEGRSAASRAARLLAVLCLDLDHFKASTTRSAIRSATRCCRRSPTGSGHACAERYRGAPRRRRVRHRPGRGRAADRLRPRSPRGSSRSSASRSRSTAIRSSSARASASRWRRTTAPSPTSC